MDWINLSQDIITYLLINLLTYSLIYLLTYLLTYCNWVFTRWQQFLHKYGNNNNNNNMDNSYAVVNTLNTLAGHKIGRISWLEEEQLAWQDKFCPTQSVG